MIRENADLARAKIFVFIGGVKEPASLYSRSDLARFYRGSLPFLFWLIALVLIVVAIAIAGVGIWSALTHRVLVPPRPLKALANQGDFLAGHFSSILGLLTIVVVGASLLLERQATRRFALREAFLRGVDQIVRSMKSDTEEANEDGALDVSPLTLRLTNYYARVALANPDEDELLIILNIPIIAPLRTALESDKVSKEYPFAVVALEKFRKLETSMHLAAKGIQK